MQGPKKHHPRDRLIGQYRDHKMMAWESPDQQDHVPYGAQERIVPVVRTRPVIGRMAACARCSRTKDLWKENNGEGLHREGRRYCCKGCAEGKECLCAQRDAHDGQELNGLTRQPLRRKR